MLHIFVCEDDASQRNSIVKTIQNTVLIEELDMHFALETDSPYELLDAVKSSQHTGIYFLDIDLKCNINGMKLAQQIRLFDPRCFIIFVTAHSELSYMTFQYRVEAMDFVLKDNPAEAKVKIRECLLNALERYSCQENKLQKTYTIDVGDRKISVDYNDIFFFETSNNIHKIILHAKDRQIEFSGTIKDLENILDDNFLRCHRSFLINKNNIQEVDTKNRIIYFKNGETCLISTRMIKGI